jgi:hypothetical protein
MAIGNRNAYSEIGKSTYEILRSLRDIVRPDLKEKNKPSVTNDYQHLMDLWKQKFGDPDEAEKRIREQKEKQAAAEKAVVVTDNSSPPKIKNTKEYIRKHLFR